MVRVLGAGDRRREGPGALGRGKPGPRAAHPVLHHRGRSRTAGPGHLRPGASGLVESGDHRASGLRHRPHRMGSLRQRGREAGGQDRLRHQVRRRRQCRVPVRRGDPERRPRAGVAAGDASCRAGPGMAGRLAERPVRQGQLRGHRRPQRRGRAGGAHQRSVACKKFCHPARCKGCDRRGQRLYQQHQRGHPDMVQAPDGAERKCRHRHQAAHCGRLRLWR